MRRTIYLLIAIITLSCANKKQNLPENFDFGTTKKGFYTNNYFNLEVSFDPNWSIQDKQQMNQLIDAGTEIIAGEDKDLKKIAKAAQVNVAYLLTVFKHDIGTTLNFNPSFLVIAENVKMFQDIKDGSDYLQHAKKLLERAQVNYYFEKDFYPKTIGDYTFHVMEAKIDQFGTTITQEYFCSVINGFTLSFVASYSTENEKKELYKILQRIKLRS